MEKPNETPTTEGQSPVDEVIPYVEPEVNPSKTGPGPKQLVSVEVFGYELGKGKRRRIVNPDDVYKLAALGCTDLEISRWFDIDNGTLRYNFMPILEKGREDLKLRLRQAQIKLALDGNPTMLIWLGKQMLGQQENPVNTEANAPLPWSE